MQTGYVILDFNNVEAKTSSFNTIAGMYDRLETLLGGNKPIHAININLGSAVTCAGCVVINPYVDGSDISFIAKEVYTATTSEGTTTTTITAYKVTVASDDKIKLTTYTK